MNLPLTGCSNALLVEIYDELMFDACAKGMIVVVQSCENEIHLVSYPLAIRDYKSLHK